MSDAMPCLYCRIGGCVAGTVEHYLPERFGEGHPFTLPRGAVCDDCQNYASHDLDKVLWDADAGSKLTLWRARIPGKRGKRGILEGPGFMLDPEKGTARFGDSLKRTVDQRRTELYFAGALYKVALGHLAWCRGMNYATHQRFDDVGRYVRAAKKHEIWPFTRALGRWISEDVQLAFEMSVGDENILVGMQLATVTYWTSLSRDLSMLHDLADTVPFGRVVCAAPDDVGDRPWSTLLFREPSGIVDVCRGELTADGRFTQSVLTEAPIQRLRLDVPLWDPAARPHPTFTT